MKEEHINIGLRLQKEIGEAYPEIQILSVGGLAHPESEEMLCLVVFSDMTLEAPASFEGIRVLTRRVPSYGSVHEVVEHVAPLMDKLAKKLAESDAKAEE